VLAAVTPAAADKDAPTPLAVAAAGLPAGTTGAVCIFSTPPLPEGGEAASGGTDALALAHVHAHAHAHAHAHDGDGDGDHAHAHDDDHADAHAEGVEVARSPASIDGHGGLRCASPAYPARATLFLDVAFPPLGAEAALLHSNPNPNPNPNPSPNPCPLPLPPKPTP
jgi:hypothetical protein